MAYVLSRRSKDNLESILKSGKLESNILVLAVKDFIKYTPIDFCIIHNGGYRTAKTQKGLFDLGNSKCDGYKIKSKHQSGLAVDLIPYVGVPMWRMNECLYLAGGFLAFCSSRGIHITSGADWNGDGNILHDGWDPCHFEIKED